MPSNRELRSEIEALSEELGVSVSASGLSNAKLTELLEDLKAKREQPRLSSLTRGPSVPAPSPVVEETIEENPSPTPPPAPPAPDPDPPAPPPVNGAPEMGGPPAPKPKAVDRSYPYTIAPGKSCTSLRGILGPGKQAKPEYFSGGQKTLDHLVEKGIVIKR